MAVLQLNDKQYDLSEGTIRIGAGADADVVLPTDAALGVQAVIGLVSGIVLGIFAMVATRLVPPASVVSATSGS